MLPPGRFPKPRVQQVPTLLHRSHSSFIEIPWILANLRFVRDVKMELNFWQVMWMRNKIKGRCLWSKGSCSQVRYLVLVISAVACNKSLNFCYVSIFKTIVCLAGLFYYVIDGELFAFHFVFSCYRILKDRKDCYIIHFNLQHVTFSLVLLSGSL